MTEVRLTGYPRSWKTAMAIAVGEGSKHERKTYVYGVHTRHGWSYVVSFYRKPEQIGWSMYKPIPGIPKLTANMFNANPIDRVS